MDFDGLKNRILYNCDVTDARHAGTYSVCGLVMRLRDLYKWEHRLPPWREDAPAKVLDWIGHKEDYWEKLMAAEFGRIRLNGQPHDAFDTIAVNSHLRSHNLYYGAGYAYSLKPTFFLADIVRTESICGHTVCTTGMEHARDLLTLPAFTQDGGVVFRTEAARMFLWDQIVYLSQSGRKALGFAARVCGLPDARSETIRMGFHKIWLAQKNIYIRHEIGELEETVFNRAIWQQMLVDYPHTAVELLVRTLKDLLADTGPKGVLTHLIENRDAAGLGLYMAFGNGITRMLTKALICAFDGFIADSHWPHVRDAARKIRRDVTAYTHQVLDLYHAAEALGDLQSGQTAIEGTMVQRGLVSKPQN